MKKLEILLVSGLATLMLAILLIGLRARSDTPVDVPRQTVPDAPVAPDPETRLPPALADLSPSHPSFVRPVEPSTGSYCRVRAESPELPSPRSHFGCVSFGKHIWVLGGTTGSGAFDSVLLIDPVRNIRVASTPLPDSRRSLEAVVLNKHVYALGGTRDPDSSGKVFRYEPDSGRWTERAPMCRARANFGAAVQGGRLYVFGGDDNGVATSDAEVYDPATNCWTRLNALPYPTYAFDAVAGKDGRIYLLCCWPWRSNRESVDVIVYDPMKDAYTFGAAAPHPHRAASAVHLSGNRILVAGGSGFADVYDYAGNRWTTLGALPYPMKAFGTVVMNDKVYLVGGEDDATGARSGAVLSLPQE